MSAASRQIGSATRPNRRLRSRIIAMLREQDAMTAWEIAASAYGRRLIVRRGWHRTATETQLWATRRALRRLVRKGWVVVTGRYRRRLVFALREHSDD
jgi:hypothetical protein